MKETRRLSTIVFVDIAGYTAIMQNDETKALSYLQTFKKALDQNVSEYQGQIVQYFGDGCLLSFESASQGVRCAMALQETFQKHFLPVRLGMHLGEVIFNENNAYGDGVNIASRIESMGVPGAILFSKTVRDQIKNKLEFEISSLGVFEFKNVNDPMQVYALANPGFIIPAREKLKGKLKETPEKKRPNWLIPALAAGLVLIFTLVFLFIIEPGLKNSEDPAVESIQQAKIAVMPFQNLSPDNNNLFYCNGIMQNVIDNLSKIPELIVLPSRTTNHYKNASLLPTELGEELGVQYIIDGTFQKIDSQIQVTVALTSTHDGRQIWTNENVTFSLPELFSMQARIANQVANQLMSGLGVELNRSFEIIPTQDELAYEYYLRGKETLKKYDSHAQVSIVNSKLLNEAKLFFNLAIERDPGFASAYLGLANVEFNEKYFANFLSDSSLFQFERLVNKALELDPELSEGHFLKGLFYLKDRNLPLQAEKSWQKALDINPNNYDALYAIADLYLTGKFDLVEGIRMLKEIEYRTVDAHELSTIYLKLSQCYSRIMDLDMEWYYLEKCNHLDENVPNLAIPWFYLRTGKSEKALAELSKRFPAKGNQFQLVLHGLYHTFDGQFREAINYYEQWENLLNVQSEDNWYSINDWHRYGQALVKVGGDSLGSGLIRRQIAINKQRIKRGHFDALYDTAGSYSFLNMADSAYYYLDKFYENDGLLKGWGIGSFILVDYQFDNIRSDARFIHKFEAAKAKMREIRKRVSSVDPTILEVS